MTDPTATLIRPLRDDDVEAADEVAWNALNDVGRQFGFSMGVRDDERIAWGRARIRHMARFDPQGSVVAEQNGEIVGIGLAIRRQSLWHLSLLAVKNGLQGAGVGRKLLDATLEYAEGCDSAMICATPDPRALRRYGQAGFTLNAGYEATGTPDRTAIPKDLGVREGDWDRDTELVEELITACRGAGYGPDLQFLRDHGMRLLVRDGGSPADRAIITTRPGTIGTLAAASDEAATKVLWAAIAEAPEEVTMGNLVNNLQWAIRVALDARLSLRLTDTLCTRGALTVPDSYLVAGVWG